MATPSTLESLPNEILLEIISFLEPKQIITLQLLSKRLLRVSRDNVFWRLQCHRESSFLEGINRRRGLRFLSDSDSDADANEHLVSAFGGVQHSQNSTAAATTTATTSTTSQQGGHAGPRWPLQKSAEQERIRIAANWDPTFPGERVNWYDEYIQRNGPIAVSWFEQPRIRDGPMTDNIEVKGAALYAPDPDGQALFAVAPLDDGSVCLWDVRGTRKRKGAILSKSEEGLLCLDSPGLSARSRMASIGITECISVDSSRNRAFIAVQSHIMEVDLQTLQIVAHQPYEWSITTLSEAHPATPLTVGTLHGIHLYDSRTRDEIRRDHQERIDGFDRFGLRDFSRVLDPSPLPPYAPFPQSGPQSILHLERAGVRGLLSDDIFVAGRFPSIIHYDRRMFPAVKGSLHSGARLCSLASLPYPFSCVDSDLRRRGELSLEQVERAKSTPGGRTLIAAGEYNTKGSLEIYGLSSSSSSPSGGGMVQNSTMKNRQTASRVKLLSVINHGTRILFSDGDGFLKWAERDGFTEVRRHRIGPGEKIAQRSIFASMPGSDEIARKLLSTETAGRTAAEVNSSDVLFWTGDKLGLVGFSSRPGFDAADFEDEAGSTRTPEEVAAEKAEQLYNERMRLALERQANDVRFVRYLGAGIRNGV